MTKEKILEARAAAAGLTLLASTDMYRSGYIYLDSSRQPLTSVLTLEDAGKWLDDTLAGKTPEAKPEGYAAHSKEYSGAGQERDASIDGKAAAAGLTVERGAAQYGGIVYDLTDRQGRRIRSDLTLEETESYLAGI